MAFSFSDWANLAAMISAMTDVINTGREAYQYFYDQRIDLPSTRQQAFLLQNAFSTYSDDEIESIKRRIQNCRDRFISEGSGQQRATCICSVLRDVKDGNGGSIPDKEWERSYEQLKCDS